MCTLTAQRWIERRTIFRRPDEQIDTRVHDVAEIPREVAKAFVERHHYSGSFPASSHWVGLHERGELVGVAVFSVPARPEVVSNVFPALPIEQCRDLGRFVLLDRVAGNGESWFLARAFELLRFHRKPITGVVSFSDPAPRATIDGRTVMPGHVGTIYQASNAVYVGRSRPETIFLLPDGRSVARRSFQKVRDGVRGWRPVVADMVAAGADPLSELAGEDERTAWLAQWLPRVTRPFRHPGNHKYAWVLERRLRRHLPESAGAYPKQLDSLRAAA
jgi:hypothetical protein